MQTLKRLYHHTNKQTCSVPTLRSSAARRLGALPETSHSFTFLSVEAVASRPGAAGQKDSAQVALSCAERRNSGAEPENDTNIFKASVPTKQCNQVCCRAERQRKGGLAVRREEEQRCGACAFWWRDDDESFEKDGVMLPGSRYLHTSVSTYSGGST